MSLYRIALRAATVMALKGQTMAGDNVFDSRNDPLEEIAAETPVPVIAVYTDEDMVTETSREVGLVIEFTVNVRATVDGEEAVWVPKTDDGLELTLDFINQEIRDALEAGASPAAAIWQTLVTDVKDDTSRRGILDPEEKTRLAARQIMYRVRLLRDPKAGGPVPQILTELLAQMSADTHYAPVAPMLQQMAERKAGRAAHLRDMARLQINLDHAHALRMVPDPDGTPAPTVTLGGKAVT